LITLVRSAESYTASDPQSSLTKCRIALELALNELLRDFGSEDDTRIPLAELMTNDALTSMMPTSVFLQAGTVRRLGNCAVHGESVSEEDASCGLQALLDFLEWYERRDVRHRQLQRPAAPEPKRESGSLTSYDPFLTVRIEDARMKLTAHAAFLTLGLVVAVLLYVLDAAFLYVAQKGAVAANSNVGTRTFEGWASGCFGALAAIIFGLGWKAIKWLQPYLGVLIAANSVLQLLLMAFYGAKVAFLRRARK
jgi:hypothetical protein